MTTNSHAAPWTIRRFLAQFIPRRSTPNLLQTDAGTWSNPFLTGREATAWHLFGESCQWSRLDMLEYDNDARLRGGWLAEADRRIAGGVKVSIPDLHILRHWGYTAAEWIALPNEIRTAKRSGYYEAAGLGA